MTPPPKRTFGKGYRKPERYKFMEAGKVARLVAAARSMGSEYAALAFELAFYLGLREGEVADLKASDLDTKDWIAWIRTLKRGRLTAKTRRIPYWKRDESQRPALPVRVPGSEAARLAVWAAAHRGRKSASGFVFEGRPGRPISTGLLRRWFRTARRKAGLDERFTFHSLRHTHATLVAAATRDPVVVRDQLRHTSVTMTDRYMRAARDFSGEIAAALTLPGQNRPRAKADRVHNYSLYNKLQQNDHGSP